MICFAPLKPEIICNRGDDRTEYGKFIGFKVPTHASEIYRIGILPGSDIVEGKSKGAVKRFIFFEIAFQGEGQIHTEIIRDPVLVIF